MADASTTSHHKAWRLHAPGDLRFDEVATAVPADDGIAVAIEAAMVLSYTDKVLSGALAYALPAMPFVPGTNAVGRVIETGRNVGHVKAGERVFLSPHLRADVPDREPAQILVGLTRMGESEATRLLQQRWRDGAFTEVAQWPAACATPLTGLDHKSAAELLGLAKLVVPYGGLKRANVSGGQTVLINGASGYFGSGAVMTALALGAARVVAVGRKAEALAALRTAFGARVVPAVVSGDAEKDAAVIREAAGGGGDVALDLLGNATSTSTTLSTLRALKRGGRLVIMGSATVPLEISFRELLANDWEVVGQFMYERTAPAELAALVAHGLIDLGKIRTATFALARLPEAISAASRMQGLDLTAVGP